MNLKNKNTIILILLIIVIIGIIILITSLKPKGEWTEQQAKCVSEKAKLFVSKTCGHCSEQETILGEYADLFEIIDCTTEPKTCINNQVITMPTWIINEIKFPGLKSISQLKQITNCNG